MAEIDPQLQLLRRQYLQLFEPDFLAWPPPRLLQRHDAQTWIFKHMFDGGRNSRLPPDGYQSRVLKFLIAKVEKISKSPSADKVSPLLQSHLETLAERDATSDYNAEKESAYITFTCLGPNRQHDDTIEPTITLLERRNLVVGSQITGFRTWDGALHLATYLLTDAGSSLINGKSVLELGAGTGFLSILLAKYLHTRRVVTTDGDERVVDSIRENLALGGLEDKRIITARKLRWGEELRGTWVEQDCDYDVVMGADITYDKTAIEALVISIGHLFELRPGLVVVMATVIRNGATFQGFLNQCVDRGFDIEEVLFTAKPIREQKALFYAAAMPMKILKITMKT